MTQKRKVMKSNIEENKEQEEKLWFISNIKFKVAQKVGEIFVKSNQRKRRKLSIFTIFSQVLQKRGKSVDDSPLLCYIKYSA